MYRFLAILSLVLLLSGCTSKPDFEFTIETKNGAPKDDVIETALVNEPIDLAEKKKVNEPSSKEVKTEQTEGEKDLNNKAPDVAATTVDWPVPFAMQAPFSNWDMPYQEMCEETALVLSAKYYKNEPIDKATMDQELKKVRDWESIEWGVYTDSTAEEIKKMGESVFGLNIEISTDVSIENIKDHLRKNQLVLVPTAGRELGNPYFKQPGPLYHVLVVRGFTDNSFITNDVGIGKGEGYKYKFQTVINAAHDLPILEDGSIFRPYDSNINDDLKREEMKTGTPRILIIKGIK